jgi:hypothetical protein
LKPIDHFGRKSQADKTTTEPGHEIDRFGRDRFRGDAQISFVFTIFIVDQNNRLTQPNILERLGNRRQGHLFISFRTKLVQREVFPREAAKTRGRKGNITFQRFLII